MVFLGGAVRRVRQHAARRLDFGAHRLALPPTRPGRNQARDWRREKRSNEIHASVTDPDARLARKPGGTASILAYAGHMLTENRDGLVSQACLTLVSGGARRGAGDG